MSRAPLEDINMAEADISPDSDAVDGQYPSRLAHHQASQVESNFVDSSGPIFSMYLEMAEEEDRKMAESWKADAEGILVFTGLFSAAVASLISVSIQDIQQNPQDTSNFYLANIYQTIADPNRPNVSSSLPPSPPSFSPPAYAVWVNSLWFLSLVISITCALLATLLQQWARRYLKVTQTRYSLHKRARIRSFFAEGVENSLLPLAVETLPTLLHLSLFLFFAGLVIFLWNVNLTIFKLALSWISVCTALYGCITFTPIFRRDSPYYTPLTPLARLVVVVILYVFHFLCAYFEVLVLCCSSIFHCSVCLGPVRIFGHLTFWLEDVLDVTSSTPEEAALTSPSGIDTRALMWTFDRLDEDHEVERFFSSLPGFHNSNAVEQPLLNLDHDQKLKLSTAMIGLLNRTFSSDLLLDQVKHYRADICANAIKLVDTPKAYPEILRRLASEDGCGPVKSTEMVHFVRRWDNHEGEDNTLVRAMFSIIVARVQRHDDSWFILASKELGIPEAVLREHAAHGDNLPLAILIYIAHQQLIHFQNPAWPSPAVSKALAAASEFNVQDTSLELQHKFCALWNQAVRKAQNDNDWKIACNLLRPIRKVYIILHQGTDSAPTRFSASTTNYDYILMEESAYPVCSVTGHIHDDSASKLFADTAPQDNAALSSASLAGSDVPFLSVPTQSRVGESLTPVPPLDDSHPTYQTIDSLRIPVPSPYLDAAVVPSSITMSYPTPEASITPPLSSASSPAGVAFQHNPYLLTHSAPPNLPSSSFNPFLDSILPTESHCSIVVTSTPSASPKMTSAPDLGAPAKDDGGPIRGLHNGKDTLEPPSVNRSAHANTMATLDLSPHSPALASVTDSNVAIASHSLRGPNAEHRGDHPPGPSHNQYDMV